ncbi:MAG: hypothetical protein CMJ64_08035 [Planctomycetaceae bacterium]|nr:hypothetical protein [Planctomycetaceae bacterium]|tara:strand:- start:55 stop:261 length:207 start_codon:yes stop_codon:yes gene_type:complete
MPHQHKLAARLSRRELLRFGLRGFSGLSLSELLKHRADAAESRRNQKQDTAIIFVWLPGGHSHLETYD